MAVHRIESLVTGTVWKLECRAGDSLAAGQTLMILESMKMEIPIEAPAAGRLQDLYFAEGDSVKEGEVLAMLISA